MVIQVTYLLTEYRQVSVPADSVPVRRGFPNMERRKKAMLPES